MFYPSFPSNWSTLRKMMLYKGVFGEPKPEYETVSGPIASFVTKRASPLRSLVANIEPVQSGSGDPSPDNVRPISGWSEVNMWRTGFNVWDEEWEVGIYNSTTGEKQSFDTQIRSKNFIPVQKNTVYYFNTGTNSRVLFYGLDYSYIGSELVNSATFTTPANCGFINFHLEASYGTTYNHDISINYPATDHDYHPYSGNQYTIQLGQTVYGGTLDVTNGVLTVEWVEVDLGDCTWITAEHYRAGLFGVLITGIKRASPGQTTNAICSQYKTGIAVSSSSDFQDFENGSLHGWRTNDYVYFYDTAFVGYTRDEVKAAMSGVQLVYELATPITIPLTPTEISTLQGANNLWADSGDVTVEYRSN